MKRSKVFLGITSCLLAIAGFASVKSHFTSSRPFYYTGTGFELHARCVTDQTTRAFTTLSGDPRITTLYGLTSKALYNTVFCKVPIYVGAD